MKIISSILTAVLIVMFISCSSAANKNSYGKIQVIHEIKYSNKGTRSEGRSWYLKINGTIVPDCFTLIAAGGNVYSFRTKNTLWGDDGYILLKNETAELLWPASDKILNEMDLSRGWVDGPSRCKNTPAEWIFVKWSDGSASASPQKIEELVKAKSLKIIPRNRMLDKILKE